MADRARQAPRKVDAGELPLARQPGVNRNDPRTFAELDFIAKAENIVFVGPTGVGKTGLASACCSRRCRMAIGAFHARPGPLR